MNSSINFVIFVSVFVIGITNARIYYVDVPEINNDNPSEVYNVVDKNNEAPKDLEIEFSADEPKKIIYLPRTNKYSAAPSVDILENDRPIYLNKWPTEVPTAARKIIYSGDSSSREKKNSNVIKLDKEHKGEVIIELRVIANNDVS